jgi:S-adenosylmethionine decarboxylase
MGVRFASKKLNEAIGRHCVAELGGGCPCLIDDENYVRDAIVEAARKSGASLLNITSHKFQPQGVTAIALLSESHISFHSWPEKGYAAVDAFTCGTHCDPEVAIRHLKDSFKLTEGHINIFQRFMPSCGTLSPLASC